MPSSIRTKSHWGQLDVTSPREEHLLSWVSHRGTISRHRFSKEELCHGNDEVGQPQPLGHAGDPHRVPGHCRRHGGRVSRPPPPPDNTLLP
ncbi:hypothetical protein MC885_019376 [Smutsia gigantea]|nr:hypothetical protein MC885_019376 [Smutsia gigantea]